MPRPTHPEILTLEGKLYLCIVLDVFSNLVVGWSMHHRQDRRMVVRAVQMLVWQRSRSSQFILHSDRGGQFISGTYPRYMGGNALVCSIRAARHRADNAACEGFFGILNLERANHRRYRTHYEVLADLFDCLEQFHNPRVHRRVAGQDRRLSALTQPSVEMG